MDSGPTTVSRIADAFDGPQEALSERVNRAFLEVWDGEPHESEPLQAPLCAAIRIEQATRQLRELIQKRVIVGRRLVGIDALVAQDRDSLVTIIAPGIPAILAGRPPLR